MTGPSDVKSMVVKPIKPATANSFIKRHHYSGKVVCNSALDLIGVKRNTSQLKMPDGSVVAAKTLAHNKVKNQYYWLKNGAKPLPGFQIKYIYFLDKASKKNLTVPILPYSAIKDAGASMYLGEPNARIKSGDGCDQQHSGGATPTDALQLQGV